MWACRSTRPLPFTVALHYGPGGVPGLCRVIKGQRGPGDSITSVCHILLHGPASLHLSPAPSWPHGRSPVQVCPQKHTRKQNISTLPVCMRTVGTLVFLLTALYSTHFKTFPSFFKGRLLSSVLKVTDDIPECRFSSSSLSLLSCGFAMVQLGNSVRSDWQ